MHNPLAFAIKANIKRQQINTDELKNYLQLSDDVWKQLTDEFTPLPAGAVFGLIHRILKAPNTETLLSLLQGSPHKTPIEIRENPLAQQIDNDLHRIRLLTDLYELPENQQMTLSEKNWIIQNARSLLEAIDQKDAG